MKTNLFSDRLYSTAIIAATVLAAGVVGCSKQDRADASATAQEAYADTKKAAPNAWRDVK